MAIVIQNAVTSVEDVAVNTTDLSYNVSDGTAVVYAYYGIDNSGFSSGEAIDYGGQAMELIAQIQGQRCGYLFRLKSPNTGTQTVTASWTGNAQKCILKVIGVTGLDQTTPNRAVQSVNGATGNPSLTNIISANDEVVLSFLNYNSQVVSPTEDVGQTEITGGSTVAAGHTVEITEETGAALVDSGWTGVSAPWSVIGMSLNPDGVAADVTPPTFSVAPAVTSITASGGTATATINETGDIYYVVVADGASAPTPAEVIAGTGSGGSGELDSGSALAGTALSNAFTGLSDSTPYDVYFVARDDEGTPNVQAAVTKVDFTTTAIVMTATSITAGTLRAGDVVTVQLSDANNASGKTLSCPAGFITITAQDINSVTFVVPEPKTFGTKVLSYSVNTTLTVTDGIEQATIDFQIAPEVGHAFEQITALTGIYADDVGLAIGDRAYGYWTVGTGSEDLTVGAINSDGGGTFRYWIQDDTDSVWGGYADEVVVGGPDVTAPVLSSPTGTQTAYNTADGTVSTNEGNGTLYYYASQNASETASTIKASGNSQAVGASGAQNVSYTGLAGSTTYYAHYVQDDSSSNESSVVVSASFTTPAAPDVTAPTLTLGTGIATGNTTADGSVTTNEGNGTLYYYASVNASETAATIKASGGSQAVGASGVQSVGFTSLSTDTTYYAHYVQDDSSANESAVVSSGGFDMPDTIPPVLSSSTGTATGAAISSGTVSTNEGNGTLYYLATQNASETAATVKAGSSKAVSATGVQTVGVTGLTPETTYYLHYVQDDSSSNESNVGHSSGFTTLAASDIPAADRISVGKIADYLRSTEAYIHTQTNEIVFEWLLGEGISRSQLNNMLYTYLLGQGYTGTLQDMMYKWSKDV